MPLPYKTAEEKKAFLESYKDIYKAFGMTDAQINDYINKRLETTTEEEMLFDQSSDIIEKFSANQKNATKYDVFLYKKGGEIGRIIHALAKPETSIANIEYNEALARKLQSRDGIVELLQEAVTRLATADKKIFTETEKDFNKLYEQYNIRSLAFVTRSLKETLKSYRESLNITEEEIPKDVETALERNEGNYALAESEHNQLTANCNLLNLALPKIDELAPVDKNADPEVQAEQKKARAEKIEKAVYTVTTLPGRTYEFKRAFPGYIASMSSIEIKEKDVVVFEKETETEKAFYKKITERMAKEEKDYSSAREKAEKKATDIFLIEDDGLCAHVKGDIDRLVAEDKANKDTYKKVIAENQKLSDERLKLVKPQIIASYNKPIKDMIEDMYTAVKDGSIMGHHNENYQIMLDSLKEMRELVKDGQIGDNKHAFRLAMENLGSASTNYLLNKHLDDRKYSSRALNRIAAATLCAGIFRGFKSEYILEDTLKAKKEINPAAGIKNKLSTKELSNMYCEANARYCQNPTAENFAVIWSIDYAYTQMEKKGFELFGSDLYTMIEGNQKLYAKLAEDNADVKRIMEHGVYNVAKDDFSNLVKSNRAVKNVDEEPKQKVQENQKNALDVK